MSIERAPRKRTYQERLNTIGRAVNAFDAATQSTHAMMASAHDNGRTYTVKFYGSSHIAAPFAEINKQMKLTYVLEDATKRPIDRSYSGGLQGDLLMSIHSSETDSTMCLVNGGEVYQLVNGRRRLSDPSFIIFSKMNATDAETLSVIAAKALVNQTQALPKPHKIYQW